MRLLHLSQVVLCILFTACSADDVSDSDNTFHLTGEITGDYDDLIYLTYDGYRDSARVTDGRFVFTGILEAPRQASLLMNGTSSPTWVYLDDPAMQITADYQRQGEEGNPLHTLQNVVITGSPANDLYTAVQRRLRSIVPQDSTGEQQYRYYLHLIDSTGSHPVIGRQLASAAISSSTMTATQLDTLIAHYDTTRMDARAREVFAMGMATRKSYSVGDTFPDFPLEQPDGKMTRLSELRGLQVYVDLWASWCSPCRQQHPRLKEIADAIDGSNLVLVSISTDKDRDAWLRASEQDGLSWSSYRDADHLLEEDLAISAIPKSYRLNERGVIVEIDPDKEDYRQWAGL